MNRESGKVAAAFVLAASTVLTAEAQDANVDENMATFLAYAAGQGFQLHTFTAAVLEALDQAGKMVGDTGLEPVSSAI